MKHIARLYSFVGVLRHTSEIISRSVRMSFGKTKVNINRIKTVKNDKEMVG